MDSLNFIASAADLLVWYNAVFVTFFGVGLFFTMLQLIGLGGETDADADVDADVDIDADLDADVDIDADIDLDADVDADVDADIDADADLDADMDADADADVDIHAHGGIEHAGGLGFANTVAQLFGLGKVPLSVSLMVLCYTIGVAGWVSNEMLADRFASASTFFPVSLLIALTVGFAVLRALTMTMARYMPAFSTSAMSRRQLVGLVGQTVLPVNERIGRASLHDKFGTLQVVKCCVRPGTKPIAKGEKVVLVKYVPSRSMFIVGRA